MVVVVSEETGVISVAMDGEITRYLDPQTLYKILVDFLVPISEEASMTPKAATDENA